MIEALNFLLNNKPERFGDKLYRQVEGIPLGINLLADVSLYYYESLWLHTSLLHLVATFNKTYRYLDFNLLFIYNPEFFTYTTDIYPNELFFNKSKLHCTVVVHI